MRAAWQRCNIPATMCKKNRKTAVSPSQPVRPGTHLGAGRGYLHLAEQPPKCVSTVGGTARHIRHRYEYALKDTPQNMARNLTDMRR